MAATATATRAPRFGEEIPNKPTPIPRERMKELGQDIGTMVSVVLEGDQQIEPGPQDVRRWSNIGPRLTMYQWLRVSNDTGSMIRFMEVDRIHGSPGAGLRALSLRDLWPPCLRDLAAEPIVATGEWYVRHCGAHKKWVVVMPNGNVRVDGINTETEARNICHRESGNPKPIGA